MLNVINEVWKYKKKMYFFTIVILFFYLQFTFWSERMFLLCFFYKIRLVKLAQGMF